VWRWALALGFAIALGGGVWIYDVFGAEIHTLWPRWKAEGEPWLRATLLWIEFLASITVTVAILCWFTALFFCLFCAILFSLPRLLEWCSRRTSFPRRFDQIRRTVGSIVERDRLLGTICNLCASIGALFVLTILLRRPLDYWDIGIQVVISTAIELIVLQILFANGQFNWLVRKLP
jgi:hypothetical protein